MLPDKSRRFSIFWLIGATLLSLTSFHILAYQTPRFDFPAIAFHFVILALVYLLVVRVVPQSLLKYALFLAILMRFSLLLAVPELSDDFYRFIWDGRLLSQGISPFETVPSVLMEDPVFNQDQVNQELYRGMNSPGYFTVYPPLAQWIFYLTAIIAPENIPGNVALMRLIIILFESATIWLSVLMLRRYQIPSRKVLVYAWNPLVIMELTGNLHFEAIMIFFVVLALYLFDSGKWKWSAGSIAAATAAKLVPLIFLPLLIFRMSWKKVIGYWAICGAVITIFFLTIWSPELINGLSGSLSLYFQKFEFNASIYYLVREIGYAVTGYNIIEHAGRYLALTVLVSVMVFSWFSHQMKLPAAMTWVLTIYLLFSTTVHPWYLTTLVALAVFTDYRFPLAWSVLAILSYSGYTPSGYQENTILVVLEYLFLFVVLAWDLKHTKADSTDRRFARVNDSNELNCYEN